MFFVVSLQKSSMVSVVLILLLGVILANFHIYLRDLYRL